MAALKEGGVMRSIELARAIGLTGRKQVNPLLYRMKSTVLATRSFNHMQ